MVKRKTRQIKTSTIKVLAQQKRNDAQTLLDNNCYDSAVYLAGYAIELMLKRHIAMQAGWTMYPPNRYDDDHKEKPGEPISNSGTFISHDLKHLAVLGNIFDDIIRSYGVSFSLLMANWDSEQRYADPNKTRTDAGGIIKAVNEIGTYLAAKTYH